MTDVELELLSDKDKYLFFEAAKRGGICVISHRYAKANIPGQEKYSEKEPTSHLMYLDANNLYGECFSSFFLLIYICLDTFDYTQFDYIHLAIQN